MPMEKEEEEEEDGQFPDEAHFPPHFEGADRQNEMCSKWRAQICQFPAKENLTHTRAAARTGVTTSSTYGRSADGVGVETVDSA